MLRAFSLSFCGLALGIGLSACATNTAQQSTAAALPVADVSEWQRWFPDAQPPVSEVLANNNDLSASAARARLAAANAAVAGAARQLQADATLQGNRSRRNIVSTSGLTPVTSNSYDLALNLSWEVDLWQRLSLSHQAAVSEYRASEADIYATQLNLIANSYRAWFNIAEAQAQQRLQAKNRDIFSDNAEIIERNFLQGTAIALDVRLTRSSLANSQNQLIQAESTVAERQREFQLLASNLQQPELTAELPANSTPLPANLNTSAIELRPDLLAARLRLNANNARYAAAKKNLLPTLRLTGSVGENSRDFKDLFDLQDLVWNIAAGLTAPLFDGGRLRAEQAQAAAQKDIAVAEYAQAVLVAFNEVRAGLANDEFFAEREKAVAVALEESSQAEALAFDQYAAGLSDILIVLDAQRRVLDARSTLLQLSNLRLQNRINLLLALGGSATLTAQTDATKVTTL